MSQLVLAMDSTKLAGSRFVCRSLHRFASVSTSWRTALSVPPLYKASGHILMCSHRRIQIQVAAAGLGNTGVNASSARFEDSEIRTELLSHRVFMKQIPRKLKKSWTDHLLFLGLGILLGMLASSGFRPSFTPSASAATTEIFIKARPKRKYQHGSMEDRAIYALDSFFTTEPGGKAIILLAICASMTGVGGVLYNKAARSEGEDLRLSESFWAAWTFICDPGAHADVDGMRERLVAVPLTMGGMLFFALLVGLMSDGVSARVDHLQKGASLVIEENHTIVIGWTPKTVPLVRELTVANKTRGLKRTIVVLGDRDKKEMDHEMKTALPSSERHGSKIVTRSGIPTAMEDLRRCSAAMARAIILLSPAGLSPHEADALVLHTALVLAYLSELKADIVVELAELENVNVLKEILSTLMNFSTTELPPLLKSSPSVSSDPTRLLQAGERSQKMVPVATGDIVMRMLVERALQPEIAAVAGELLRFEGSEFRFKEWPELVGKTFAELLYLFDNAIPCGMRKSRPNSLGGYTLVNPPPETVFEKGDRLLVISEDEASYRPGKSKAPRRPRVISSMDRPVKKVLKLLICGWRHDLRDVIRLIDNSVAKGSEVTILTATKDEARIKELKFGSFLHNLKVIYKFGDPLSMKVLEALPMESYQKAIILTDQKKGTSTHSATTIAMFIRHIQLQRGTRNSIIVAELPSSQEDALQQVERTWLNDSVQPEQLQAMVLAHLAEDSDVGAVLDEVVSDHGSNMVLRSIGAYAKPGEAFNFWELQARAHQLGDLVIAYKCAANQNRWLLNPLSKSKILSWSEADDVLVLTRPKTSV